MNKNKVILLHGFKSPTRNDFDFFIDYSKTKDLDKNFILFNYFENNILETIEKIKFTKKLDIEFEKHKNDEIIVVAYSLGAAAALDMAQKYKNIKKIIFITPSFKISYVKWVGALIDVVKSKRRLKKKLGKERYKNIIEKNKTFRNKHPIKLIWTGYMYIWEQRKKLKYLDGKEITFLISKNDQAVKIKSNLRYIKKHINFKNNQIKFDWVEENHFSILEKYQTPFYERLIKEINEESRN